MFHGLRTLMLSREIIFLDLRMSIVSLRPRHPTFHTSAFRISRTEECLIVKDWSKIVNDRREVLVVNKQKRNLRLGDRFICMLQYDESGELYMFYAILPERERAAGVIS